MVKKCCFPWKLDNPYHHTEETHEGVSNKPQSMKYPDYPSGGFVINLIVFYDDAFTKMAGGEYPYKGEHAAAKAEWVLTVFPQKRPSLEQCLQFW